MENDFASRGCLELTVHLQHCVGNTQLCMLLLTHLTEKADTTMAASLYMYGVLACQSIYTIHSLLLSVPLCFPRAWCCYHLLALH